MRLFALLTAAVLLPAAVAACASSKTVAPSVVSGNAAISTFRARPVSVAATDESGTRLSATLGADARFSLALPKGHTYELSVVTASGSVPIVFPRQSGKLDASFVLATDGARLALGNVRYLAAAPGAGFKVQSTPVQGGATGDCVDCAGDDQQTSCEDGSTGGGSESESTGATDGAAQADPTQEMAVGDQNAPDQVEGCDNQEGDSSDVQQEGEH